MDVELPSHDTYSSDFDNMFNCKWTSFSDYYSTMSFCFVLVVIPTGVRSISWRGPMVTVGTGFGDLLFYDVRNCKFLQCDGYGCCIVCLHVCDGYKVSIFFNNVL